MSFAKKTFAVALASFLLSSPVAFAQAGGGDVPENAKKQGEREQPGSTGKSTSDTTNKDGGAQDQKSGDKP